MASGREENKTKMIRTLLLGIVSAGLSALCAADEFTPIYQTMEEILQDSQQSQQLIDQLTDQSRDDYLSFREQLKINDGLMVYNAQLQEQIAAQNDELVKLNNSIDQVTLVERQIMPLMLKMVDSLELFIANDLPFSLAERQDRITFVRNALARPDVSVSEKYRQVLEAYLIEIDYGKKIESYQQRLLLESGERDVDLLRFGRTVLAYQTLDQSETGIWNRNAGQWQVVSGSYRASVRDAIRMARKQQTPGLVVLPVVVEQ